MYVMGNSNIATRILNGPKEAYLWRHQVRDQKDDDKNMYQQFVIGGNL